MCITVLLLFAVQGAWAQYVSNTENVFTISGQGEKPCMQVIKSSYVMEQDLNVYDVRINYAFLIDYFTAKEAYQSAIAAATSTYETAVAHQKWDRIRDLMQNHHGNEWNGDVWLKLNGNETINLSTLTFNNATSGNESNCYIGHADYWMNTQLSSTLHDWPWSDDGNKVYSEGKEVSAKMATTHLGGLSNVYVSLVDTKDFRMTVNEVPLVVKTIIVRIGIERTWQNKDISMEISGRWRYRMGTGSTADDNKLYSLSTTLVPPTVPFLSANSPGTLTRSGNCKLLYTAPSFSDKKAKQVKSNGVFVNELEDCSFVQNIWLMKDDMSSADEPLSILNNASNRYALIQNSSSGQTQEITVTDNYDPVVIYPCWEMESANTYYSMPLLNSSNRYKQHHYKYMNAISVKGFPRPKDVTVETVDAFSRKVCVKWNWEVKDQNNYDKNGKWYVFRTTSDHSQTVKIGEVGSTSATSYSLNYTPTNDNLPAYETGYNYVVCFVPNGWTVNSEDDVKGLSASVSHAIGRKFDISTPTTVSTDENITVNWEHSLITDASATNKYTFEVQRSEDESTWETKYTGEVSDASKAKGSWVDTNISPMTTYYYRVVFPNLLGKSWESDVVTATSGGSDFVAGSFRASRGEYSTTVKLTWQVRQVGNGDCHFTLQRRPLGSTGDRGWADIYTTTGSSSTYSYEDQTAPVGSFNEYKLTISEKNAQGVMIKGNSVTTDGFCMATGTMSGRVSFGSGTAVDSVKVTMRASSSSGNRINRFRSLYFDGIANETEGGTGMSYTGTTEELAKIFGNDFTVQMWINPSSDMSAQTEPIPFFDIERSVSLDVQKEDDSKAKLLVAIDGTTVSMGSQLYVDYDKWTNVVLTYKKGTGALTLYTLDGNTILKANGTQTITGTNVESFGLANWAARTSPLAYKGYIDEFRAFNIALTQADIERNYNHPMVGSEDGLQVYYTFDEGLANQKFAYDFSKQNGISNGHHGTSNMIASSMTNIPDEDQFGLQGYTDKNGNYMIGGIGFSGDGTNYVATPTLGIHQFSPSNESRFFSMNSLVYTGVDFEDVSSFPVSGTVYYSHSTIPVKDVYVKVDGIIAARDGKPVQTNERGEFTVDVPIGKHFVSLEMNGHTFEKGGRYPEDKFNTGERTDFNNAISGLLFYDNTTVTVAGRVAGGDIEYNKPLGLNNGKANIGRATLRLEQENGTGYLSAVKNATGNFDICATDSTLRTASGTAMIPASQNHIIVKTNPTTGEWVAQLPPLRYKVMSAAIDNNDAIVFNANNLPVIDATNPNMVYTDSIQTEDGEVRKFEYVGSAKIEYKAPSTLDVIENEDGSFGMKDYTLKDVQGNEHKVDLYSVDNNGKVHYAFGIENIGGENTAVYYGTDNNSTHTCYPVYEELSTYTYKLYAYERYVNKDGAEEVVDEVPLIGKKVTIQNQFASTAKIICNAPDGSGHEVGEIYELEKNTFELDSLGCGTYEFTVGYPNIQAPYTRGLTITYGDEGNEMSWSGNSTFKAFILGSLPMGNNFVTQGPDEILMVLRDPPGTGSSATWTQGTTVTVTKGRTVEPHSNTELNASIYAGVEQATGEGIGFMVIQDLNSKATIKAGAEVNLSYSNMKNTTTTVTTTRDISTSDGFDFNGPEGDLFIGSAKNLLFGASRMVDIQWNVDSNKPVMFMEEALSTGEQFTTGFAYSQNYVKNTLIPNLERLRDSTLVKVTSYDGIPRPAKGEEPIYVTTLRPGDAGYGTSNNDSEVWGDQAVPFSAFDSSTGRYVGPSYAMIMPLDWENDTTGVQDMVNFYNLQIQKWERQLYLNEEAKVTAIENSKDWLKENHSFDAGGVITVTTTNEKTHTVQHTGVEEVNAILGVETGYRFSGLGLGVEITEKLGITVTEEYQRDETEEMTISYTLAEDGGDYLTVDVFEAPDGFGPIFYTRAGATSCPYQDEVRTEYYEPGQKVIMQSTVQVERPEIETATQALTGIPSGGKGTFQMDIRNNSDTRDDAWYDIMVVPNSNPDGLVVKMDGLNITAGRSILVEAGKTMTKTFTVEQSNPDVLSYMDVKIRIASQCQPDNTGVYPEIADTTSISVYFQPSCSDVLLASSHGLVNRDTDTKQTLSISGYNHSMKSLKGIRLQYKGLNDANFTTLQEYSKDEDRVAADPNLKLLPALEGTQKLNYVIDLRDDAFADQTYVFRAITVCEQGGEEVNNESDEVSIIRDMTLPQLMATPSPTSGILTSGDNLTLTFNEDIQGSKLTKPNNFEVLGVLNESEVAHDVALSLTGENAAKTEGTIDLNGKSFSTSLWLNYSADGTLLQHGTTDNGFKVSIEGGKLAVKVAGGDVVTSTATLPTNSWIYLNVAYNAETNQVSAGYAADASDVTLLSQVNVPAYEGNGPVSVGGNGLTAKVQELAIWNEARSMAQAQADMYTTKSQFTNGLIGYWQMDEGRGNVATDRARSRNMTLPSQNAWWINGDNYAVVLDGTKAAAVNIGSLNTTASESYLVEAWFKADEQQNGVASILSTQVMDLRLNADGKMEIALSGSSSATAVYNQDLRDGQWHHVAVNVLKSANGSGIIYVDGQQRKQLSASAMPALYGNQLVLGAHKLADFNAYDQLLKGAVDEVRIWKGNRTADIIKSNMYQRAKGDEAGLVAYYPMEHTGLDAYNQMVTTVSLSDRTNSSSPANELTFYTTDGDAANGATSKDNTAALKQAPKMENVQFSFVASERQITVNLEELPSKIEGCNIYITAKNVKDINGNRALPITWSVYVQQNNLKWQENSISVTKEGDNEQTFTATIENHGSQSESWTLNELPTWLTANVDGGIINPLSSAKLTFTVAGSLPIGTYETTVYLTGSQDIATPLYVTVSSEGDAPDWVATAGESTMTIVGVLNIDGVQSNDPKDMVAAFRGQECVGVASPKYFSRYDSYMLLMNIYGKDDAELTYKAYDASTGTIYPSVQVSDNSAYTFGIDKALGSFTSPVTLTPLNEVEQDLSMDHEGWKWFSLFATPKDPDASVVFKDATSAIAAITDGSNTIVGWLGQMEIDNPAAMYKLNATGPYVETIIGAPTDPTAIDITLKQGWTWIGYPAQAMNSLSAAFASVEPQEDDMVKSQTAFAIYTDGDWVGTLTTMVPGEGYLYNNKASAAKTFRFPKPVVSGHRNAPRRAASHHSPLTSRYQDNMTMVAVVKNGNDVVENAQVSVYAYGELRAFSAEAVTNDLHFLTIGGQGSEADLLTFVVQTADGEYMLSQTDVFVADAQRGTLDNPVVLQLSDATGIDMAISGADIKSILIYDNAGRVVDSSERPSRIFTKGDLKQMPAGVYYQHVIYSNGMTRVQKLMK